MGNIHIRLGNIFDNSSDLVLLPCSAKGTFTKAAREHQTKFQIPPPNPMALGGVQIIPFTGSGVITRYVAWCASVLDDTSSPDAIERIAQQVGKFTQKNPHVRLVESPLLGAGHGKLSVQESALALAKGFRESSHSDATLAIFCMHGEVVETLRRALDVPISPQPSIANVSSDFQYDVFLSYSSKDKTVVRELAARLKKDGIRVWLDEEQIKPGDSIPAKIEDGLERSRVLVLCISANAFGSDWAQLEAGTFRFRDPLNKERRLIPVRLDDAPIKGSLVQFLYIDWRAADREQEYAKLLAACRGEIELSTTNKPENLRHETDPSNPPKLVHIEHSGPDNSIQLEVTASLALENTDSHRSCRPPERNRARTWRGCIRPPLRPSAQERSSRVGRVYSGSRN